MNKPRGKYHVLFLIQFLGSVNSLQDTDGSGSGLIFMELCVRWSLHLVCQHFCSFAGAPMKSQIWDLVPNGTKVQIWSQKSPNFACKSQI